MIPTPHIEASNKEDFAKTVLMPGDPLRAKFIAEHFLENVKQVNGVRNMFGYTGYYNGKKVTVMGSGMGMPSIGIYSYELFKFYDVDKIIRIGSAGSYTASLDIFDIVLATEAYSESTFAKVQSGIEDNIIKSNSDLNNKILETASKLGIKVKSGMIHSSDVFYHEDSNMWHSVKDMGCLAVEMESFALFANAISTGKKATCLLTISDSFISSKVTTSEERQNSFTQMMKLALESVE